MMIQELGGKFEAVTTQENGGRIDTFPPFILPVLPRCICARIGAHIPLHDAEGEAVQGSTRSPSFFFFSTGTLQSGLGKSLG